MNIPIELEHHPKLRLCDFVNTLHLSPLHGQPPELETPGLLGMSVRPARRLLPPGLPVAVIRE
jgi:hypothetical protein